MSEATTSYEWVYKIILSCKHYFQFDCVDVLIDLFNAKYGDEDLYIRLQEARQFKYKEVHNILN